MSKKRQGAGEGKRSCGVTGSRAGRAAEPLKPRRGLLVLLTVLFGIWVAGLLAMYLGGVYRSGRHATTEAVTAVWMFGE